MGAYAATQRQPMARAEAFDEGEIQSIRMNGTSAHANAFIEKLAPAAEAASRETGIPAHFILSQVALESGWGKSEIRTPGGARTHNVLGVKAGDGWKGPTVHAYTTEYVHGRPQHVREEFRVYGSYKEALKDYAKVLTSNTRYASALHNSTSAAGFANGMQKAGYATDPHYASKLLAIIKQMV
jgi:flagellar protein FlgJ